MRERTVCIGDVLQRIDAGWSPLCDEEPPRPGQWGVLKVSAVTSGNYRPEESKTLLPGLKPRPEIEVRSGDVIMCRANGVKELVGATAVIIDTPTGLMLSDKTLRLVPDSTRLDPRYFYYFLSSHQAKSQIARMVSGSSGQSNISQRFIRSMTMNLPPLGEQQQIAEILESADDQIQAASHLLVKQESVLASIEIAAVQDASSSPQITVGEIIRNISGGFIQTGPFGSQLHAYEYTKSGVPVVMPQDMIGQSISGEKIMRIPESKARILSRHRMVPGDVVFGRRGDLSRCAVVTAEQEGWLCGTGCLLARLPSGPVRPEWLALAYRHDLGQRQVLARAVGSTMANLNTKVISDIRIPVPGSKTRKEQPLPSMSREGQLLNSCLKSTS
jgi:hypothetical protein